MARYRGLPMIFKSKDLFDQERYFVRKDLIANFIIDLVMGKVHNQDLRDAFKVGDDCIWDEAIPKLRALIPNGYIIAYHIPAGEKAREIIPLQSMEYVYVEDLKDLDHMLCWIDKRVYQGDLETDEEQEEL